VAGDDDRLPRIATDKVPRRQLRDLLAIPGNPHQEQP